MKWKKGYDEKCLSSTHYSANSISLMSNCTNIFWNYYYLYTGANLFAPKAPNYHLPYKWFFRCHSLFQNLLHILLLLVDLFCTEPRKVWFGLWIIDDQDIEIIMTEHFRKNRFMLLYHFSFHAKFIFPLSKECHHGLCW